MSTSMFRGAVLRRTIAASLCAVAVNGVAAPLAFVANKQGAFPGTGEAYITAIASARLTRAGIDDIVVTRGIFPPSPSVKIPMRLLAPQPDGTVTNITTPVFGATPPGFTHPRHVVFEDFNRDGRLDLFIAGHGYDAPPFSGETNGLLLSAPGSAWDDRSTLLPTQPDFSHSAAVGDINGDGNPDVCVINIYSDAFVGPYCLLGNGGTAFVKGGVLPSYVTTLAKKYTTSLMFDVDRDGHPDLILGCDANAGPSLVLFNDGTGDFTKRSAGQLPVGLFGDTTINLSIATIDINADGIADLLLSQTSLNYVGYAIQVLVNDGLGTFADRTTDFLPMAKDLAGPCLQFIRVLDLNGDGIPDIYAQGVSGAPPGNNVFAWVSDTPGHFVAVDSGAIGGVTPFMVVFTDQDGDGSPDLVSLSNGPLGQIDYRTYRNVTPFPACPGTAGDFDKDGRGDLLWRNATTGETRLWQMNGANKLADTSLFTDTRWTITHSGDFDHDGRSDLVWHNASTGQTAIWLMNGGTFVGGAVIFESPQWKVAHVADFNGDGISDLLWHNAVTNTTGVWLMNGTSAVSSAVILGNTPWRVSHTGDFDGDGKADLLWRHPVTGQTAVWLMDGTTTTAGAVVLSDPKWAVTHVADFNGDGKADLVWRNLSTGQTAIWLVNGTSTTAAAVVFSDPAWSVTHVADLNADGKADLIWRASGTRATAAWLMNGLTSPSTANLIANSDWKVWRTGDYNGDGNADLVWRNDATGQTAMWLMNGTTATSAVAPLYVPAFAVR